MRCGAVGVHEPDLQKAVQGIATELSRQLGGLPQFVVVYGRASYIQDTLAQQMSEVFPNAFLMGGSSCRGAMVSGLGPSVDLAVFGLIDVDGAFGVGAHTLCADPVAAGQAAVEAAIDAANRPGEVPDLVWIAQAPGTEEEVLAGIAGVIGDQVPVLGGSTADDDVAAGWRELCGNRTMSHSVVVGALFLSGTVGFAFHSGYDPTDRLGTVTSVEGRRLLTINNESAAEWYHKVTDQGVLPSLYEDASILAASTLTPLGRRQGQVDGVPTYLLAHPDRVYGDGSLSTFATLEVGEEICLMRGTLKTLTTRASRVVKDAMLVADLRPSAIGGALIVYCGGCMLTVGESLSQVKDGLQAVLGSVPFVATYTFGETGQLDDLSRHGNLMISALVFEKD